LPALSQRTARRYLPKARLEWPRLFRVEAVIHAETMVNQAAFNGTGAV